MNHKRALTLAVVLLVSSSCASTKHVALPPLSPTASPAETEAYAQAMRGMVVDAPTRGTPGWTQPGSGTTFLLLGNGTRVTEPEDIVVVVGPESVAGQAAQRAAEQEASSDLWNKGVHGLAAAGLGIGLGGIVGLGASVVSNDEERAARLITGGAVLGGIGVVVVGLAAALEPTMINLRDELAMDRATAFAAYNDGLAARVAAVKTSSASRSPPSPLTEPTSRPADAPSSPR